MSRVHAEMTAELGSDGRMGAGINLLHIMVLLRNCRVYIYKEYVCVYVCLY